MYLLPLHQLHGLIFCLPWWSMPRAKRQSTAAASAAEPQHAKRQRRPQGTDQTAVDPPPIPSTSNLGQQATNGQDVASIAAMAAEIAVNKVLATLSEQGILSPQQPANADRPPNQGSDPQPGPSTAPVAQPPVTEEVATTALNALLYSDGKGECNSLQSNVHKNASHLVSTPLGYHVEDRVKAQIWANQYVDYKALLPGNLDKQFAFKLSTHSGQPTVQVAAQDDTRSINNIDKWLTAHNTYTYIYIQRYPKAAAPLLKYSEIVRDLAKRSGPAAFRYYDETFRALRQSMPDLRFEVPHQEIWMTAMSMRPFQYNPQASSQNQPFRAKSSVSNRAIPKGYCYSYNSAGTHCKAQNCQYKHLCPQCHEQHPKFKCGQNTTPAKQPKQLAAANPSKAK